MVIDVIGGSGVSTTLLSKFGSSTILLAIRRASSLVSGLVNGHSETEGCRFSIRQSFGLYFVRRAGEKKTALANSSIQETVKMRQFVTCFLRDESGVTAIEYGLIAALISVVCIGAMTFAGQKLLAVYNDIGNALAGAL